MSGETFRGKTWEQLKTQRIELLSRVLDRLEHDVAVVEKSKKPVPRDLCEKLRLVGNELRVEQGKKRGPDVAEKDRDTEVAKIRRRIRVLKTG